MFKQLKKITWEDCKAFGMTVLYSGFILDAGFSALALRSNIPFTSEAKVWLGNFLAAFTLMIFLSVVWSAVYKPKKQG